MTEFLLLLFGLLALTALIKIAISPEKIYEYPYFMAVVFIVFLMPQIVSLTNAPGALTESGLESFLLMTDLCFVACFAGYNLKTSISIPSFFYNDIDKKFVRPYVLLLIIFSYFFLFKLSQMSEAETGGATWSGTATLLLFLAGGMMPASALAYQKYLKEKNALDFVLFVAAVSPTLIGIIFYGRREPLVFVALTVLMTRYFLRGKKPYRFVVFSGLFAATLFIPSTGIYRTTASQSLGATLSINYLDNFSKFLSYYPVLEARNAGQIIERVTSIDHLGFGAGYWNNIVFRYVPAQIVGAEFKQSLMARPNALGALLSARGSFISPGSTITGIADSFMEFWYFGSLFFALQAQLFRQLWQKAKYDGAALAQIYYVLIAPSAMRSVTHQTSDFIPAALYIVIFLLPLSVMTRPRRPVA